MMRMMARIGEEPLCPLSEVWDLFCVFCSVSSSLLLDAGILDKTTSGVFLIPFFFFASLL